MKIITSCEDPYTAYLEFFDVRFVFRDGKYVGWYTPSDCSKEVSNS